jgi:hypothetical protein
MLCRDFSLVNVYDGGKVAIPLCCRAWNCDYCAPRRRREVIALAVAGSPNRLITITVNPALLVSPAARAAALANAWRLVVKRAGRQLTIGKIEYLAVFEKTKRGEPHLHILARCGYIPQAWLSAQLKELIGAPIVDIRKVTSGSRAAAYVAKYIGKDPHRFATCKRYWHTRNWVNGASPDNATLPSEQREWRIVEQPLWALHEAWKTDVLRPPVLDGDMLWSGIPPPWWTPFAREDRGRARG